MAGRVVRYGIPIGFVRRERGLAYIGSAHTLAVEPTLHPHIICKTRSPADHALLSAWRVWERISSTIRRTLPGSKARAARVSNVSIAAITCSVDAVF
jgi:hypothetical protein